MKRSRTYRGMNCPECGAHLKMGFRHQTVYSMEPEKKEEPQKKESFSDSISQFFSSFAKGCSKFAEAVGWVTILGGLLYLCYILMFPDGVTNIF